EAPYRQKLLEQKLGKLSPEAQLAHKTPPAERTTEQINQIQETASLLEINEKEILGAMSKEERARHKTLRDVLAKFPKPPPLPMTLAVQNSKTNSAKAFVLIRGDYNRPGEEVQAGLPEVLQVSLPATAAALPLERAVVGNGGAARNRAGLAEWITYPQNP